MGAAAAESGGRRCPSAAVSARPHDAIGDTPFPGLVSGPARPPNRRGIRTAHRLVCSDLIIVSSCSQNISIADDSFRVALSLAAELQKMQSTKDPVLRSCIDLPRGASFFTALVCSDRLLFIFDTI